MMVMTMMMMVIPWKHTCHDDEDDILRRIHIPVIMTNIISLYCVYTSHLLLLGKFEYSGGPIFKVVLEC